MGFLTVHSNSANIRSSFLVKIWHFPQDTKLIVAKSSTVINFGPCFWNLDVFGDRHDDEHRVNTTFDILLPTYLPGSSIDPKKILMTERRSKPSPKKTRGERKHTYITMIMICHVTSSCQFESWIFPRTQPSKFASRNFVS